MGPLKDPQSNAPFIHTKEKKKKIHLVSCEQNNMTQKLTEPKESGSFSSCKSLISYYCWFIECLILEILLAI